MGVRLAPPPNKLVAVGEEVYVENGGGGRGRNQKQFFSGGKGGF